MCACVTLTTLCSTFAGAEQTFPPPQSQQRVAIDLGFPPRLATVPGVCVCVRGVFRSQGYFITAGGINNNESTWGNNGLQKVVAANDKSNHLSELSAPP